MKGNVTVQEEDFDLNELKEEMIDDDSGAVVIFNGIVRGHNEGDDVESLEIQKYEGMTEQELEKVKDEAVNNFKVNDILIIHRYGKMDVGDNILGIVVSAEHREEAFDACRYCIDRLKEMVPLWKKEKLDGGEDRWLKKSG